MKFKFVDHTADIEYIAYGRNNEELFSNALEALFETVADIKALRKSKDGKKLILIEEKADSLDALLLNTLQDTFSTAESERVFCYEIAAIEVKKSKKGFSAYAKILSKEKKDKYAKLAAKGISRYEFGIKGKKSLEARVVVDV